MLPVHEFGDVLLAEVALSFERAQIICVVLWRPIVIIVNHGVAKVGVDFLQFSAKLVDGNGDAFEPASPFFFVS